MKILFLVFIILIYTVGAFGQAVPSKEAEIFPDTLFIKGENDNKEIALTFDNGPDKKNTPKILDILKEKNIEATFFLIGQKVKKYPQITKRITKEGHQLANHSWTHSNFRYLEDEYILIMKFILPQKSLKKSQAIILKHIDHLMK
ncbi:MAG: polysaccharide deacetylase family protein [Bacillota bacterium]